MKLKRATLYIFHTPKNYNGKFLGFKCNNGMVELVPDKGDGIFHSSSYFIGSKKKKNAWEKFYFCPEGTVLKEYFLTNKGRILKSVWVHT